MYVFQERKYYEIHEIYKILVKYKKEVVGLNILRRCYVNVDPW